MSAQNYITGNPFRRIRYITPIEESIRIAIKRAKKANIPKQKKKMTREQKIALKEATYIRTFIEEINKQLSRNIGQFPSLNEIHPFYFELLELVANSSNIRRILGRIGGIIKEIEKIKDEQIQKLKLTEHPIEMAKIRRETLGKVISLMKKAEKDVKYLIRATKRLRSVPDFDPSIPVIAIAGAPNVGKSSLVRVISTAEPEVGEYPFTTKRIIFGHRKVKYLDVQIVDTPGILDKPFEQRNTIEKQSIVTIRHIADIIVFIFDISSDAAITIKEQMNLVNDIETTFTSSKIIRVLNKIDLLNKEDIELAKKELKVEYLISIKEKVGLEKFVKDLEDEIVKLYMNSEKFSKRIKIEISEEYRSNEKINNPYEL